MPVRFANVLGGSFELNDGHDIPVIGFGTGLIKEQETLTTAVRAALQAGYRQFDTAHIYENEHLLGHPLQELLPEFGLKREDIFITTKVPIVNEDPAGSVDSDLKESLEKLQTTYLDLVLVHFPRDRYTGTDDDERNEPNRKIVWQKLEEYRARGTIRSIGVSNYEIYHLEELFEYAKVKPVVNQCEYHPYCTQKLLRRYCAKHHIIFQAYSSLGYNNDTLFTEPAVVAAASKHGVSPQIVLLAFGVCTGAPIIPKSITPSRITSNLQDTLKVKLTPEEISALAALDKGHTFYDGCHSVGVI